MDKANPSLVVAGYIKVVPKDREAFVKVLQAHVPGAERRTAASPIPSRSTLWTPTWCA